MGDEQTLQQFSRDADEMENWIAEKLQLATEESYKVTHLILCAQMGENSQISELNQGNLLFQYISMLNNNYDFYQRFLDLDDWREDDSLGLAFPKNVEIPLQ